MNNYTVWKILAITMTFFYAVNAYGESENKRVYDVVSNYKDHGLDGYLLSIDEKSGLLIPPESLSKDKLIELIVKSEWKDKYCKVSIEYGYFDFKLRGSHYCLHEITDGPEKGKFTSRCCGGKICKCSPGGFFANKPVNCYCKAL